MNELFLGFVGGLVAWFASSFLGEPLVTLLAARRDTQQSLYFYANILPENREHVVEAIDHFRSIAAKNEGLRCSLMAPLFRMFGFDLAEAVVALTGLSNSMSKVGPEKARVRVRVQRALKLPVNPDDLETIAILG